MPETGNKQQATPQLTPALSRTCRLLYEPLADALRFLIYAEDIRVVLLQGELGLNEIEKSDWLHLAYRSVQRISSSPFITVSPKGFLDEAGGKAALQAMFPNLPAAPIFTQHHTKDDLGLTFHSAYVAPEYTLPAPLATLEPPLHIAVPLVHYWHYHSGHTTCSLYLHVEAETLFLALFNEGKLMFFNALPYQEIENAAYFILHTFTAHNLNPERHAVRYSGQMTTNDDLHQLLHRYIRTVTPLEQPQVIRYGPELNADPSFLHFYTCLL